MRKDIIKLVVLMAIFIGLIGLIKTTLHNERQKELSGEVSQMQKAGNTLDKITNIGNPDEYDKDRSILRYAPVVFVIGGVWFIAQDTYRKFRGKEYSDYYRPFWKEEPFGGFHPEYEDEMGNVYGSDRDDGRGLLGYRSYGTDDKDKQKDLQQREEAVNAGYNPYQEQQPSNEQQPSQTPNNEQQAGQQQEQSNRQQNQTTNE